MAEPSIEFQLRVWGCAYTGDPNEVAALTAECRTDRAPFAPWQLFDQTAADLTSSFVHPDDGDGWVPCPRWWALPYVAEHLYQIGRAHV